MDATISFTPVTTSYASASSSSTKKMAKTINLIQPRWSYTSISFPSNQKAPLKHRKNTLLLTFCSTKPGINSNNNATSKNNPAIELDSNSISKHLPTPTSNQPISPPQSKGLIFDLGPKNSWDSIEIGSPIVKRYIGDNEERWYMWYHGRSSNFSSDANLDRIGLAVSSNGIHWARGSQNVRSCADAGEVMDCSKNWWAFDTHSIRPSEIVIMSSPMYSSVYWLYYTGFSSEEVEISGFSNNFVENPERFHLENRKTGKILKSLPGLACSQDGRHWARIEGDYHSGALLEVGAGKEWDSLFISSPHVVVHKSDDLRMYYYSFDQENRCFAIGVARSRDGIRWVKLGKIMGKGKEGFFDEFGTKNACVVRNSKDGNYLMAYEGVAADGKRSIGLAISQDGLKNWKRIQENPILQPSESEDGWDCKGVRSPYLIQMEDNKDEWTLYYDGVNNEGRTGIGMAISEGSNFRSFRKGSGLHL